MEKNVWRWVYEHEPSISSIPPPPLPSASAILQCIPWAVRLGRSSSVPASARPAEKREKRVNTLWRY